MALEAGSRLGQYEIERLLGRGGMGEVWLARHADLGRSVALKILPAELASDARFRRRFLAESRLAASLDHPNIVPIYEAGEVEDRLFIAMRFVEGSDLGRLIEKEGRLAPERTRTILRGIADAIDSAHDRNLIHRDVKPGNILLTRTAAGGDHAYLSDFGLTKQVGSSFALSRTGQIVGSVGYVAPEQIEGREVDGRADVYSLACVLYECLTGRPPFASEREVATLWAHLQRERPHPSAVDPALASFDPIVARGMAIDPEARYARAVEMFEVDSHTAGHAIPRVAGSDKTAPPRVEPQPVGTRFGRFGIAAVAAVLVVVALVASLRNGLVPSVPHNSESPVPVASLVRPSEEIRTTPPFGVFFREPFPLRANVRYQLAQFQPSTTLQPNIDGWTITGERADGFALAFEGGGAVTTARIRVFYNGPCKTDTTSVIPEDLSSEADRFGTSEFLMRDPIVPITIGRLSGVTFNIVVNQKRQPLGCPRPSGISDEAWAAQRVRVFLFAWSDDAYSIGPGEVVNVLLLDLRDGPLTVISQAPPGEDVEAFVSEVKELVRSMIFAA